MESPSMSFEWRCRRCRTHVCGQDDLEMHQRSKTFVGHRGHRGGLRCGSIFLQEPLAWMGDLGETSGHLLCPGVVRGAPCGVKLGAWNWSGARCSCGAWIIPSISLVESKLDKTVAAAAAASSSLPPHSISVVRSCAETGEDDLLPGNESSLAAGDAGTGGSSTNLGLPPHAVDSNTSQSTTATFTTTDQVTIVDRSRAFASETMTTTPSSNNASKQGGKGGCVATAAVAAALAELAVSRTSSSSSSAVKTPKSGAADNVGDAQHEQQRRKRKHKQKKLEFGLHWFASSPPPAAVVLLHAEDSNGAEAKKWADQNWGGRLLAETRAAFVFPDLVCQVEKDKKQNNKKETRKGSGLSSASLSQEESGGGGDGDGGGVGKARFWFPRPQWNGHQHAEDVLAEHLGQAEAKSTERAQEGQEGVGETAQQQEENEVRAVSSSSVGLTLNNLNINNQAEAGQEEEIDDDDELELSGMVAQVMELVKQLAKKGVPPQNIFLGGLGNGGELALHAGLRLVALAQSKQHHDDDDDYALRVTSNTANAAYASTNGGGEHFCGGVKALGGLFCIGGALPLSCSTLSSLERRQEQRNGSVVAEDAETATETTAATTTGAPALLLDSPTTSAPTSFASSPTTAAAATTASTMGSHPPPPAPPQVMLLPSPPAAASSCFPARDISQRDSVGAVVAWPPVLMCHARDDPAVPSACGRATADRLREIHAASLSVGSDGGGGGGGSGGGDEINNRNVQDGQDGGDRSRQAVTFLEYKGARHDGGVRTLASWVNDHVNAL